MFVVPWLWNNKRKKINEKMARILNNTNISVFCGFFFFFGCPGVFVALRGLSCGKGGYSIVMCRLLIAVASLMEHGLSVHRLSSVALGF